MPPIEQARRRYNADGRRAQARATRERILATARTLFIERGYAGASIADIASASGVSAPTVFAGFTSKVNLLKEAVETALVGDGEPVPLADRPEMQHVRSAATAEELLERFAALIAARAPAVCPIYAVLHAAADADPQIARLSRTLDEHRLEGARQLAVIVTDLLGVDDAERFDEVRDTLWTFNSPQLYTLLVTQRGWSVQRYGDWVRRGLVALVRAG